MQALGGKVPPGLLVCRAVAADLRDRLQQYATVSATMCGSMHCSTWLQWGCTWFAVAAVWLSCTLAAHLS